MTIKKQDKYFSQYPYSLNQAEVMKKLGITSHNTFYRLHHHYCMRQKKKHGAD